MNIIITRGAADAMTESRWEFWITTASSLHNGVAAILQKYTKSERPTLRHKMRVVQQYGRMSHFTTRDDRIERLTVAPEYPPSVQSELKRRIEESIQIF